MATRLARCGGSCTMSASVSRRSIPARRTPPRPDARPTVCRPSRRAGRAGEHGQPLVADRADDGAGAVRAAVVDQDDAECARVILRQQRPRLSAMNGASSRAGTTIATDGARRRDRPPAAPVRRARTGHAWSAASTRSATTGPPAMSASSGRSMPAARNQATASSTASRAGRAL